MLPDGNIRNNFVLQATLSPAEVAANTTAEQTFTVRGLKLLTDMVGCVSKPTAQAGLGIVGWRISADDTLAITFSNNTASPITPTASQVYLIQLLRIDGTAYTSVVK